jgi:hypothetical protein
LEPEHFRFGALYYGAASQTAKDEVGQEVLYQGATFSRAAEDEKVAGL